MHRAGQRIATRRTAAVVQDHIPADLIQPWQRLGRHFVTAAPCRHEHLGDNVITIIDAHASDGESPQRPGMGIEQ